MLLWCELRRDLWSAVFGQLPGPKANTAQEFHFANNNESSSWNDLLVLTAAQFGWNMHKLKKKKKRIKEEFVREASPWTGCSHSLLSLFKLAIPSKATIQVHGDCSFNMIKGIIICSGILQTQQSRVIRPAWGTGCVSAESSHLLRRQAVPGCSQGLSLPATTELFLSCLPLCKLTPCFWAAQVSGGCGGPLFLCVFRGWRGYFPKNQLLLA